MDSRVNRIQSLVMARMRKRMASTKHRIFLLEWRKHRRLTLERLAEMAGVTTGAVHQLEQGKVNYTQPMLEALARALNCTPADLIERLPSQTDDISSFYQSLNPVQQSLAIELLKTLKRSG